MSEPERPSLRAVVPATELHRETGDVLALAEKGPVGVSKHGKTRYVVLDVERYDRLSRADDPRRVLTPATTPPDVERRLLQALEDLIIDRP